MEQYRVVLVDDEEEIRMGISRKIDWVKLGFSLAGQAQNGVEALEVCEQVKPDVVITDIKMPFMDGLELGRRLRQALPAAKLVILTGFDDFEFARQAVSINVFEYLLKPVDAQELSLILDRLHQEIERSRAELKNVERLRRQYEETLPVPRGMFYTRLLDGSLRADQVYDRAGRYELTLTGDRWIAALLHVGKMGGEVDEMVFLTLQSFFDQYFELDGCTLRTLIYNDQLAIIASFVQPVSTYTYLNELERVRRLTSSETRLRLTIGVGEMVDHPWELSASVKGARNALDYRVLLGSGRTIYIQDVEPRQSREISFDENDEQDLIRAVKVGTEDQVRQVVGTLMEKVRSASIGQCQMFFLDWMNCLLKVARDGQIPAEEIFGKEGIRMEKLADFSSPGQMGSWCFEHCLRLWELLDRRRSDSTWNLVDQAKEYILNHFSESDLSVDTLCAHLHLSPTYFSTLFKKNTGMSFTSYVTKIRMETAVRLLRDTDEKNYRIAEKTGYLDPNYFSYVFKRYYGVTPSKFRAGTSP